MLVKKKEKASAGRTKAGGPKEVGLQIRRMRESRKWTVNQLSIRAKIAPNAIRAYEAGKKVPTIEMAHRLADAFAYAPFPQEIAKILGHELVSRKVAKRRKRRAAAALQPEIAKRADRAELQPVAPGGVVVTFTSVHGVPVEIRLGDGSPEAVGDTVKALCASKAR